MSGIAQQPNWDLDYQFKEISDKQQEQLKKSFDQFDKKLKEHPRITEDVLNGLEQYLLLNESSAFDMYINVYESLHKSEKLWKRERKSLEKIKTLIEGQKNFNKEKVWEYQLTQEIKDELEWLQTYWKHFQKWNVINWFNNIPKEYEWNNVLIESFVEEGNKIYTSTQMVEKLYTLNESRKNKIKSIVKNIDVSTLGVDVSWSFDAGSHNAQKIVTYIKAQWWEIIHDYREYPSFVTADVKKKWENDIEVSKKEEENPKTESESGKASEEGVAETETNAAVEVVKETIDLIDFNASSIIEKIEGTEKNWYNNVSNKAHIEKAINEISKIAKEKSGDKDLKNLVDLLKQWNIREFQIAIWLDEWNAWNQADGKIWKYTLNKLNEFIEKKEEGNNTDEVPNDTNSASSSVTNSAESRNASNTAPETPIEYSRNFIDKNIKQETRKAYAELFEVKTDNDRDFTKISTFFKKILSDINKEDIKILQKELAVKKTQAPFFYRGERTGLKEVDVDGVFWPKTLSALEALVKHEASNKFKLMKQEINNNKVLWWTNSINIKQWNGALITLIGDDIVRKENSGYYRFDKASWMWQVIGRAHNIYSQVEEFEKLANKKIPNFQDFVRTPPQDKTQNPDRNNAEFRQWTPPSGK